MAASAYHSISKEVKNPIFNAPNFLGTYVCINNTFWQSSEIIIFFVKILYSYFRYTGRLFLGCAPFVAHCNIIRALWETKKELSYRKKYMEEFVRVTSHFLTAHPPFYVIFCCFLCLLPPFFKVTYLLNGPYKDTWYCYGWYSVWWY